MNDFIFALLIGLLLFAVWQFVDMVSSKMSKQMKALWIVVFLLSVGVASIAWFFARKM